MWCGWVSRGPVDAPLAHTSYAILQISGDHGTSE
jgi:hypothetical protein